MRNCNLVIVGGGLQVLLLQLQQGKKALKIF